ncbi:MAG TPA: type II toxin-antitoxin system VapC family toxin [Candidatus Dormibacteraeota bacterium]|nr:type II toxin-antitoxin system VapC family toxin [Candidatus Dormibacteraeota bacterium]
MKFFVDANVVVYSAVGGPYQRACADILLAVGSGVAEGYTSTAAMEEVWHLELSGKAGAVAGLTRRAHAIFSPLLPVTDEAFQLALAMRGASVGSNDRLHAATCAVNGITVICTADAGFDSVTGLRRVDPLDQSAVQKLLAN